MHLTMKHRICEKERTKWKFCVSARPNAFSNFIKNLNKKVKLNILELISIFRCSRSGFRTLGRNTYKSNLKYWPNIFPITLGTVLTVQYLQKTDYVLDHDFSNYSARASTGRRPE
jgi:hypothetical protein